MKAKKRRITKIVVENVPKWARDLDSIASLKIGHTPFRTTRPVSRFSCPEAPKRGPAPLASSQEPNGIVPHPLASAPNSVLSSLHLGSVVPEIMQRLTARLLLLFALVGTFLPLALAATPAPVPACCLRKAHHCRQSMLAATESDRPAVYDSSCCCNRGARAVATTQWAHPLPCARPYVVRIIEAAVAEARIVCPAAQVSSSQSTRAPPAC